MKIFYHSADLDGKASGAILYQKFPGADLIGIDHGQDYDFGLIGENEEIYIVDFTFKPEKMVELKELCNDRLFWIDHHETSIDFSREYKYDDIQGIRQVGIAACELVWKLINGSMTPYPVFLLGKYDVFQLDLDKNILPFQFGMRSFDTNPSDEIWSKLLLNRESIQSTMLVQDIIRNGEAILNYENQLNKKISKSMCFVIEFEEYRTLCVNRSHINSKFFDPIYDESEHYILMTFSRGKEYWKITLYTRKDDINVGKIAKRYGGGGHGKAAGFITNQIDFLFSPKL